MDIFKFNSTVLSAKNSSSYHMFKFFKFNLKPISSQRGFLQAEINSFPLNSKSTLAMPFLQHFPLASLYWKFLGMSYFPKGKVFYSF